MSSSRLTYFILRAYAVTGVIQKVDLFYSAGLRSNRCQPQPTQEKIGRGFGKNAGEWTGRVEISREGFPGSKRSMHGYILTYSRF